jgi:hypothetical protein
MPHRVPQALFTRSNCRLNLDTPGSDHLVPGASCERLGMQYTCGIQVVLIEEIVKLPFFGPVEERIPFLQRVGENGTAWML